MTSRCMWARLPTIRHAYRAPPGDPVAIGSPRLAKQQEIGPCQRVCGQRTDQPHRLRARDQPDEPCQSRLPRVPQGPQMLHAQPRGAGGGAARRVADRVIGGRMREGFGHPSSAAENDRRRERGRKLSLHGRLRSQARAGGRKQAAGFFPNGRRAGRHGGGSQSARGAPRQPSRTSRNARLLSARAGAVRLPARPPPSSWVWVRSTVRRGAHRHTPASRSSSAATKSPDSSAMARAA